MRAANPAQFGLGRAHERLERRTRTSKTFLHDGRDGDGREVLTSVFTTADEPLHYRTGGGEWDDVDLAWDSRGDEDGVEHSHVQVRSDVRGIAVYDKAAGGIRFLLPARAEIVPGQQKALLRAVNLGGASSEEAWARGLDWTYETIHGGVKLSTVVDDRRGVDTFAFRYQPVGDVGLEEAADGSLLAGPLRLPRPVLFGADGSVYPAGPWRIDGDGWIAFELDDSILPQQAFPYTLDPTTTVSHYDSATLGRTGVSYPPDTPDTPTGPWTMKSATAFEVTCSFWRWDTASIDDDAIITAGALILRPATSPFENNDNRAVRGEWYPSSNWPITDPADWTALVGNNALAGTDLDDLVVNVENTLPLINVAANVDVLGLTGMRVGLSGGAPSAANRIWAYTRKLSVDWSPPESLGIGVMPGSGGGGISAGKAPPEGMVEWRMMLCDRAGRPLSPLTGIAKNRSLQLRLNRPARLSFTVPANDPLVAGIHTDGLPLLEPLCRVVKAYSKATLDTGIVAWVLRFAGYVWQLEDAGDGTSAWTSAVCFDPLQYLRHRRTAALREYTDQDGGQIARNLVATANATAPTGITVDDGVFEQSPTRTVRYERAPVADAIIQLADAFNGFDIELRPLDRQDGVLCSMNAFARLGQHQPSVIFGWAVAPHNVREVHRLQDGDTIANHLIMTGASGTGSDAISSEHDDATSQSVFGYHEDVDAVGDVTNTLLLEALGIEELGWRKRARELVRMLPQPGRGPQPWVHYHLGDTVYVYAGSDLRGGLAGVQRIYGWTVELTDEAVERVTEVVVSPE